MQVSQIRDKYKQILEEPQSQNSDDEWQIAYSQMAKQRKKRILTQANPNKCIIQNSDTNQVMLGLKQKLAQSLNNCKEHSKEIQRYKKMQLVWEDQKNQLQENINELNKTIEQEKQNARIKDEKVMLLQQQMSNSSSKIQQLSLDRQLHQKQSQYYRAQFSKLSEEIEKKQKQFKQFEKDIKQFDRLKRQNQYLKSDIQRLSLIIEDSLRFGKVSSDLMKKHFLGKPYKEMQFWYPQQLVAEVEHFLKKQQMGYGNKEFTGNLVKLIDKCNDKAIKQSQLKIKSIHSCSKSKENHSTTKKPSKIILDNSSYKKHSYHMSSLRQDLILKSTTNNFWKANESKTINQNQSSNCVLITVKSLCWEVITEFKTIVFELLLEKEVKRKKIKKLIDSMCNSIMQSFDNQLNPKDISMIDQQDPFSNIKLGIEDITAPLKNNR